MATAAAVKRGGAKVLRGGAFKPRSSPYSFQGLGEDGPEDAARTPPNEHDLKLVSEVMDVSQIDLDGLATPTSTRSAPATCRTSRCCASWARRASPCC